MLAPFDELLKETFYEGLISVFIGRKAEPNAACYSLPVFHVGGGVVVVLPPLIRSFLIHVNKGFAQLRSTVAQRLRKVDNLFSR